MRDPNPSRKYTSPFEAAIRLLARRARSVQEVRVALSKKGYSEEEVEETIFRLQHEYGYLNDSEFANAWSRYRAETSNIGINKLIADLMARGINRELAQEAVEVHMSPEGQLAKATLLGQRKWEQIKNKSDKRSALAKVARFLTAKGFTGEVICRVLSSLNGAEEQHDEALVFFNN